MTRPAKLTSSLELILLGTGEVRFKGERVELPTRKALALLMYLALEGATSRSKLAGLLWSDNDDAVRFTALEVLGNASETVGARVQYGLMMNAYKRGQYDAARVWAKRCRALCQRVGVTTYLINVCTMEGVFAAIAGDPLSGIASLETARDEARRIGHPTYQFAALANLFELHFQRGDVAKAHTALEEMRVVRPAFLDPFEEAAFTRYQSQALWFAGDLGAAITRARHAIALDDDSGAMEHRQLGRLVAAGLYLHLRDTSNARGLLSDVRDLMSDSSLGFHRADFELKNAQLELLSAQPDKALERLNRLELSGVQASKVTHSLLLRAQMHQQLGQRDAALVVIRNAPALQPPVLQQPDDLANLTALHIALEPSSRSARDSAHELLAAGQISALASLELRIALGEDEAGVTAQMLALHRSLEGHAAAQRGLVERFRR
jgi:hypothetical protein